VPEPEPEPAPVLDPEPSPIASVRVQISTEPPDAEVFLDDHRIPNPFDADLPQTTEPRNLRVEREGYTTRVQDLVLEFPQRVVVTLRRGRGVDDGRASARRARDPSTPPPAVAQAPDPVPPSASPPTPGPEPAPPPEGERRAMKNPFAP
jgi:hypothetical protein